MTANMRPHLALLLVPLCLAAGAARAARLEGCALAGKALHGKVKIVDSFADFKVQIVTSFPDLRVRPVTSFPDACGKWQFVESFPDFTVTFIDSFPDFTIAYVNSFPGLP